jgi:hypothetical protein
MLLGRVLLGLLVLAAPVACRSRNHPRSVDREVKAAAEHLENTLATPVPTGPRDPDARSIRESLSEARRSNTEDCMWLARIDGATTVVRDAALLAAYTRMCTHDQQLVTLRQVVSAAEAARNANPDGEMLADCDATELFIASDELKKYKTADAESAALEARFTAACAPAPASSAATGAATGSAATGSAAAAGSATADSAAK